MSSTVLALSEAPLGPTSASILGERPKSSELPPPEQRDELRPAWTLPATATLRWLLLVALPHLVSAANPSIVRKRV
jgi:hypothetical protein